MNEKRALGANDLYRLRFITDPQISPDGDLIAFVLRWMDKDSNDYKSNIHVVDLDGHVSQFTSGEQDSAPRWSPDGRSLAFLSGRKDKSQLHIMPTRGGESVAVTKRKFGAGVPFWSPDSASIAFVGVVSTLSDEEAEEDDIKRKERTRIIERSSYKLDTVGFIWHRRRHLFCIDVASGTVEQRTDGDFHDDNPSWAPDSGHIAFVSNRTSGWDTSLESDIYLIPRSGGEAQRITSGHAFDNPVFSPDGGRIAVTGRSDPEEAFTPTRLYSMDRTGAGLKEELGDWDASLGNDVASDTVHSADGLGLTWRHDGIYFLGTVRGECNVLCASSGRVTLITPGRHTVTDFSIAPNGTIAYACADATHLADVYLRRSDQTQQLTHENQSFLDEINLVQPERFTFTSPNGEESEGWLLPPHGHGSGKHPLIVYIHGGPATAHGESFFFEYQFLAGQGFGVFYPNIHGSSSYGSAYQTSIQHDWGNLDYLDVLSGSEVASSRDWVDGDRLGIAGGSYGGFMTNWVMAHTERFKAGVTERSLSNMVSFYGTTDFGWLWNRAWGVYPEDDAQKLWDMSPIKYVKNVRGALMVVHSERDDRCPIEQGEQMYNALRRLGKETKMVVFPEESHELSRAGTPSRRVERLGYILDWFCQHL